MGQVSGFRGRGVRLDVGLAASVREEFWEAVGSGLSPTAAATVAVVVRATGRKWAKDAGYQTPPSEALRHPVFAGHSRGVLGRRCGQEPRRRRRRWPAGVSEHTGRWLGPTGWICAQNPCPPADTEPDTSAPPTGPMSFIERCRLEELLECGCTPARAAVLLERHRDTIRRETRRGATSSGYRARVGQDAAAGQRQAPKTAQARRQPGPARPRFCDA